MNQAASSSIVRSGGFQFRLGTLLMATAWAGLVSLGLRSPTPLWSGVIAVLTLLAVLFAVLLVIYRAGRTRAMAIGFLVFCVGYLVYLAVLAGTLTNGLERTSTPIGGVLEWVFEKIHPPQLVTLSDGVMGSTMSSMRDSFDRGSFLTICNNALACLLGVVGAIAAQVLYATRPNVDGRDQAASGRSMNRSS